MLMFELLPYEIVSKILQNKCIILEDLDAIRNTSRHLKRHVNTDNNLWRAKFFQKWPRLEHAYSDRLKKKANFRVHAEIRLQCRSYVWNFLRKASALYLRTEQLTALDLKFFDKIFDPSQSAYYLLCYFFISDELVILFGSNGSCNLTYRYYATHLFVHTKHRLLKHHWQIYTNSHHSIHLLERTASFATQWCQPTINVTYFKISGALNDIVQRVLSRLRTAHPDHPILSIHSRLFAFWANYNINCSVFGFARIMQIVKMMCRVIFHDMKYATVRVPLSKDSILLDRVLMSRTACPLSMTIIFVTVARRLGIRCLPQFSYETFTYIGRITDNDDGDQFIYVDTCNGDISTSTVNCKIDTLQPPTMVMQLMMNEMNILIKRSQLTIHRALRFHDDSRLTLELEHVLSPNSLSIIIDLSKFYKSRNMNLMAIVYMLYEIEIKEMSEEWGEILKDILRTMKRYTTHSTPVSIVPVQPKHRTNYLKFYVGIIVKFHHNDRDYVAVVVGWDHDYELSYGIEYELRSDEFDDDMFAAATTNRPETSNRRRYFYKILDHRGDVYYAAEDRLRLTSPVRIRTFKIGRFFSQFAGCRYILNKELAYLYPDDSASCNRCLIKCQCSF